MKNMISSIKTLAALLMAGAAFTACSSSDDIIGQPVQPTEPQVYTMVIKASKGSDAMTRALDADVIFTWDGTETFDVVQDHELIGTATADYSDNNETTITATLTQKPSGSAFIWFYLHGAVFDYTGQVGLLTGTEGNSISEKYDYAYAGISYEDFTVSGNDIIPNDNVSLSFAAQQSIVKFTLKDKNNNAISAKKLNIHSSDESGLLQQMSVSSPNVYGDLAITPTDPTSVIYASMQYVGGDMTLTANDGENIYTFTKSSSTPLFAPANYYDITVKMKKILARINSSNAETVAISGCKELSDGDAAALAKECWKVAGGTVYVVSKITMVYAMPITITISYTYTSNGTDTNTDTATATGTATMNPFSVTVTDKSELEALYAEGNTAWYVEK